MNRACTGGAGILRIRTAVVVLLLVASVAACGSEDDGGLTATPERPNVVFIVTDDQRLDGMAYLPQTQRLLGEQGTTFTDAVTSFPLCCPARATLLTGQYAHNHGVIDNFAPAGGASRFDSSAALPVWLQEAGYRTAHVGKWLNGYGSLLPPTQLTGWDDWFTFVDPSTYRAFNQQVLDGDEVLTTGSDPEEHSTVVTGREAEERVAELSADDEPYYLQVDFVAPHAMQGEGADVPGAPIPEAEHLDAEVTVPNDVAAVAETDLSDKPASVEAAAQPLRALDELNNDRLGIPIARSLLGVDDAIAGIVEAVDESGEADATVVIFTSDNGYLLGEHSLFGKVYPYEPSIRVPLLARGPGFQAGAVVDVPVGNLDLAPTIADLAGATAQLAVDGRSLLPLADGSAPPTEASTRAILLENGPNRPQLPHYEGVRVDGWTYVQHSTGEVELYDLRADPSQLQSLHADPRYTSVQLQLAGVLDQLRDCTGSTCEVAAAVARP